MSNLQKAADAAAAPATVSPKALIADLLERNKSAIGLSLPRGMSADRFKRLLMTAANTNPSLLACDPLSFLAAGVASAQLGLEPNDARGLSYLVPFKENKKVGNQWVSTDKVQLIVGYRGYVDLARRSGMVTAINAWVVYEGDHFTYRLGMDPHIEHVPADTDELPATITHAYAVAKIGGESQFEVLTRKQIEKARMRSMTGKNDKGPWSTDYAEMAKKTAIRRLAKLLPMTVEAANAEAMDERPLVFGDLGVAADHEDAIEATYDRTIDENTGEILTPEVVS